MIKVEEIDAALNTHAKWKKRLMDAIETGRSDFKYEDVKTDNACQFGKWLYNLSREDAQSEDYLKVKELHSDFHKVAGEILHMAINGNKREALKRLETGGDYSHITGKLVLALQNWKQKVK